MIIMINGAFGVGKTTVANELLSVMQNSMIYDPEEVGFMLRNVIPNDIKQLEAPKGDFQDLELWRELTVDFAKMLVIKYQRNLIVPMTIYKRDYFDFIYQGFKNIDQQTYHFCLTATKETIHNRLRERGEAEGNWCFYQTEKCLQAFGEHEFGEYIDTDNVEIGTIIQVIKDRVKNER